MTKSPSITFVYDASTIEEWGLPLKSIETSGSSDNWRMPASRPLAAAPKAALTSSALAFLSTSATRSTTDTFGVGTRIAMPSRRPCSSGSTWPTATAAPVVVGIIETPAARARRRSLCGRSSSFWSFVYEWTVVIQPRRRPKLSCSTLATGARQLVVHDAFEMILCRAGS